MRSPSGPRPHARRVRRFLHSFPIVTIGACAALLIAAGCSKGSNNNAAAPTSSPTASAPAAGGVPTYLVTVQNFTYHGMPSSVPANRPIVVSFTNKESFEIDHEFVVLQLPAGKTAQDVIADAKKKGAKAEDDWIHFADSGDPLPTNSSHAVTMTLPPGNYVATCWQTGKAGGGTGPPHVTIGMIAPFTASTTTTAAASAMKPMVTYNVNVQNFTYHGMPSSVPANTPIVVGFTNKESFEIDHEFVVLQIPAGKTAQDVINDAKKKGPSAEDDWIHYADSGDPIPTNSSHAVTMVLPPGNYVATCWQTGKAGGGTGPPHLTIGMIAAFTASTTAKLPATAGASVGYNAFVQNFTYHGMPATVPANKPVTVQFVNKESFEIDHEFVVLQLPPGKTAQDVINDAKKNGPNAEDHWIHFADSGDPLPTNSGTTVTMDLPPGNYVATCWQTGKAGGGTGPPHLTIGMIASFTASTTATVPAANNVPVANYNVFVQNFTYHGMPATVPANKTIVVQFVNKESFEIDHEFVVLQLPPGKTAQDVINDAKKNGPNAEDHWIHFADSGDPLPTNSGHAVTMNLPPGNYVATCWQTGKAGGGTGPPHLTIGMIAAFTASTTAKLPATAGASVGYNAFVQNFTYHGMPATVPANKPITVQFVNKESFEIDHEFVVLQLPPGKTAQDVINDAKKNGPNAEDHWIHFADSGDPLPTNSGTTVTMDLPPGNYVATCWQTGKAGGGTGPPHLTIGMIASFTASTTATVPAANNVPVANYNVFVQNFTYHGMPATVPANKTIVVQFVNKESFEIDHEFVVLQLPPGKTAQDVINDAKKNGPNAEDHWIHFADSGDPLP